MAHITIESLLREKEELKDRNSLLKQALYDLSVTAHAAAKKFGSIEHRGSFENCPSPDCFHARVIMGMEGVADD